MCAEKVGRWGEICNLRQRQRFDRAWSVTPQISGTLNGPAWPQVQNQNGWARSPPLLFEDARIAIRIGRQALGKRKLMARAVRRAFAWAMGRFEPSESGTKTARCGAA